MSTIALKVLQGVAQGALQGVAQGALQKVAQGAHQEVAQGAHQEVADTENTGGKTEVVHVLAQDLNLDQSVTTIIVVVAIIITVVTEQVKAMTLVSLNQVL